MRFIQMGLLLTELLTLSRHCFGAALADHLVSDDLSSRQLTPIKPSSVSLQSRALGDHDFKLFRPGRLDSLGRKLNRVYTMKPTTLIKQYREANADQLPSIDEQPTPPGSPAVRKHPSLRKSSSFHSARDDSLPNSPKLKALTETFSRTGSSSRPHLAQQKSGGLSKLKGRLKMKGCLLCGKLKTSE